MKILPIFLVFFFAFQFSANAQEPDFDFSRKEILEIPYPNANHARLERFAGEWRRLIVYRANPTDRIYDSEGVSNNEMILGKRFLTMRGSVEYSGSAFETFYILGYDNRFLEYVMETFDQNSTYSLRFTGSYSEENDEFVFEGFDYDLVTGDKEFVKIEIRFEREDKFVYKLFKKYDGQYDWIFESTYVKTD